MHFVHAVNGFSNTKILYGVHVMMKLSKMADSVLAAFVSCRFSWDFFFFLAALGTGCGLAKFFVIIFAFNGIRISGACDNLRFNGKPEFNFTLCKRKKKKRVKRFKREKKLKKKVATEIESVYVYMEYEYATMKLKADTREEKTTHFFSNMFWSNF